MLQNYNEGSVSERDTSSTGPKRFLVKGQPGHSRTSIENTEIVRTTSFTKQSSSSAAASSTISTMTKRVVAPNEKQVDERMLKATDADRMQGSSDECVRDAAEIPVNAQHSKLDISRF